MAAGDLEEAVAMGYRSPMEGLQVEVLVRMGWGDTAMEVEVEREKGIR